MSFVLRDYQEEAVRRVIWEKKNNLEGNSVIVLPTAAGKSICLAEIARRLNEDVLIFQPTRELLQQNMEKLLHYVDRSEVGVYSASLNEKTIKKYTFATIGSVYKKPKEFSHFKLILIDECNLVRPQNLGGMFNSFIESIGSPKIIGFTATPFRLDTKYVAEDGGMIRAVTTTKIITRMKGNFWKRILYCVNTSDLLERGYLCPLKYIDCSIVEHENLKLNISESDFDLDAYEEDIQECQDNIIDTIRYGASISKSVLVFCSSVKQAENLSSVIDESAVVSAKTPKKERQRIIDGFKNGTIKIIFNVSVLTIGFDKPDLDCIVLLRPTRSICLLQQMLGRGTRIAPEKKFCRIFDLTGTIKNVGRIETIKMVKREKWELESETCKNWHLEPLYSYRFKKKEKTVDSILMDLFLKRE